VTGELVGYQVNHRDSIVIVKNEWENVQSKSKFASERFVHYESPSLASRVKATLLSRAKRR
jgi:hypothetical protein